MPGKVSGFSLYFQAVILASSMRNRGGYSGSFLWPFLYVFRRCWHGCIYFRFFPKRGSSCCISYHISQASSCIDCLILACLRSVYVDYVYIHMHEVHVPWRIIFSSLLHPLGSLSLSLFCGYDSLFWMDTGSMNSTICLWSYRLPVFIQ